MHEGRGVGKMRRKVATGLILLILAGTACGDDGGTPSDAAATPSTSAEASPTPEPTPTVDANLPTELIGLFGTLVTLSDLKRLDDPHYDHHPEELTGKQFLEIFPDGTYVFYEDRPERPIIRGTIEADKKTLTLSGEMAAIPGFIPCPGAGTYNWDRSGDRLTFELVKDGCRKIGRIAVMISSPYRLAD